MIKFMRTKDNINLKITAVQNNHLEIQKLTAGSVCLNANSKKWLKNYPDLKDIISLLDEHPEILKLILTIE